MRLEQSFEVPVPVAQAWEVLLDLDRIAPCMPGATLTGFDGETFTGVVKVKLGPVSLAYRGNGRFLERDAEARRMALVASGQDSRGAGGASARVSAVLQEARGGSATLVNVTTDIDIAGRAAQFGRGMIADVSGKLIKQFADCLAETIAAAGVAPSAPVAADATAAPVAAAAPTVPAAVDATAPPSSPAFAVPPAPAPSAAPAPAAESAPQPAAAASTMPVFQEPVPPPPAPPAPPTPPPAPPTPPPAEEYHPLALQEPPTPVEPISPTPPAPPAPPVAPQPATAYAYEPPPTPAPLPAEQVNAAGGPTPAPPAESVTPASAPRPAPKENEPIDLLAISGAGSMLKRYAPLIIVVVLVIIALIVWAIV